MQYRTSKCPHCGFELEYMNPRWESLGDPRLPCPKCQKTVILDNVIEWELKNTENKISFVFGFYFWGNFQWSFAFMMVALLLTPVLPRDFWRHMGEMVGVHWGAANVIGLMGAVFFVLVGTYRHFEFIKGIRESKRRTANPEYLKTLKKLRRMPVDSDDKF